MATVMVASGGGHLQQLTALVPRMGLDSEVVWATPRSGLAESLLQGKDYFELPYTMPRDWARAVRLTATAHSMLKDCGAKRVISTGASPAPPFFLAGAKLGLDLHYIESATRSMGPSLSGSLVEKLPSCHVYTQYPSWANGRWHYAGSVLDPYTVAPATPTGPITKVVVSLGTEGYPFRRALQRLIQILPPAADVLWQTGHTSVEGLGITGHASVPGDELRERIMDADVFICHAGTGSALTAFDVGKVPVILPREARFGEHVDDHQQLTASELARRGLVVAVPVGQVTMDHLERTRRLRILRSPNVPRYVLQEGRAAGRDQVIDLRDRIPRSRGIAGTVTRGGWRDRSAASPDPSVPAARRASSAWQDDVIRLP